MSARSTRGICGVLAVLGLPAFGASVAARPPPGVEPESPTVWSLLTDLAIGIPLFILLPSLLFGVVAVGVAWVGREWLAGERIAASSAPLLIGGGLIVAAISMVTWIPAFGGGNLPWLGVAGGLVALGAMRSWNRDRDRASFRGCLDAAGLATVVALAIVGIEVLLTDWLTYATISRAGFAIPLFSLLPAGYAVGDQRCRLGLAAAAGAFAVPGLFILVDQLPNVGGLGFLAVLLLGYYGLVLPLIASPLLIVGASLPDAQN
jgi:hypothetical protein